MKERNLAGSVTRLLNVISPLHLNISCMEVTLRAT